MTDNPVTRDADQGIFRALSTVISAISALDDESRRRVIATALTYFGYSDRLLSGASSNTTPSGVSTNAAVRREDAFSEDRSMSPKDFIFSKKPETDIERVACLAYYLTHYRAVPFFKTFDLSKLNTEAAQIKFSNAAYAVDNAAKRGFLAAAAQGNKQLTAMGEQFVQALPDRAAARDALAHVARRRRNKRNASVQVRES